MWPQAILIILYSNMQYFVLWSDNLYIQELACRTGALNGIQICFESESNCIIVFYMNLGWSLNSQENSNSALEELDMTGLVQIPSFKVMLSSFMVTKMSLSVSNEIWIDTCCASLYDSTLNEFSLSWHNCCSLPRILVFSTRSSS